MIPHAPVSSGATHENDPAAMHPDADELLEELARLDATMAHVVASAGDGGNPDLERVLDKHARHLRALLGSDGGEVATDAIDAAKRALNTAEPAAPLRMLSMARDTLGAVVRRHAARATTFHKVA